MAPFILGRSVILDLDHKKEKSDKLISYNAGIINKNIIYYKYSK